MPARNLPHPACWLNRWRPLKGVVGVVLLSLALTACDDVAVRSVGIGIGTGAAAHRMLAPGLYHYDAWSDIQRHGVTWWGDIDLRVDTSGRITGTYRLPRQCSSGLGYAVDCVGRIGGTIFSDGTLRFGLDEGWLVHDGVVDRRSIVAGRWETRILGYRGYGTFELVPVR